MSKGPNEEKFMLARIHNECGGIVESCDLEDVETSAEIMAIEDPDGKFLVMGIPASTFIKLQLCRCEYVFPEFIDEK